MYKSISIYLYKYEYVDREIYTEMLLHMDTHIKKYRFYENIYKKFLQEAWTIVARS